MCGIFGYIGKGFEPGLLVEGIRRLEYRGYDSWGIAVNGLSGLKIHKEVGRIAEKLPDDFPSTGFSGGIAHTRWATHGEPTIENAHPHADCTSALALVHNGIIENYTSLRRMLAGRGHTFSSDTDSEVIAHLVEQFAAEELDPRTAVLAALKSIEGAYGLALVSAASPDTMFVAKKGSPPGHRPRGRFFGSSPAILPPSCRIPVTSPTSKTGNAPR